MKAFTPTEDARRYKSLWFGLAYHMTWRQWGHCQGYGDFRRGWLPVNDD